MNHHASVGGPGALFVTDVLNSAPLNDFVSKHELKDRRRCFAGRIDVGPWGARTAHG